jgi:hypothetical protein
MALHIAWQASPGQALGYAVTRLSDGLGLDFADGTFKANPGTPVAALTEGSGIYAGLYQATLDPTPVEQFPDGEYQVTIHDTAAANVLVAGGLLAALLHGGDDAPVFPGSGVGGTLTAADVWQYGTRTVRLTADGLSAIPVTDPGGPTQHTTIDRLIIALYRWFYGGIKQTPTSIVTYANDDVTPNTTQTYSDNGQGTRHRGRAQ